MHLLDSRKRKKIERRFHLKKARGTSRIKTLGKKKGPLDDLGGGKIPCPARTFVFLGQSGKGGVS